MAETYYCEKCNRTMNASEFYGSNNLEKYPTGKLNQCKKCITMHVDNWNPDTYLWILQEADVPYVPKEWQSLMMKYATNPSEVTGTTILGRYLSKMKLKQYKDTRWKDTERLQELEDAKLEQTMKRQGYDAVQIMEAKEKGRVFTMPDKPLEEPVYEDTTIVPQEDYFAQQNGPEEDLDLTEEDRTYLRLKWGKTYKPEEWVKLEQLYEEMMASYDIQGAGHKDTLKLICKTSLKANQLIDIGDIEGFQKMSKVYDSLMKSGKFTAAQNKSESSGEFDSISELVEMCEREGFIPRYYTEGPMDKVDETLNDLKNYTHTLVTEEMNLGNMIDASVRAIAQDKEREAKIDVDGGEEEDSEIYNYPEDTILEDVDFEEFENMKQEEAEKDRKHLREEY